MFFCERFLAMNKINQRVSIVASYKAKSDTLGVCFPHKMLWNNKEIKFLELGLRHPTHKGERMIHVFDMSDGSNDYRLEFDAERLTWTLLEVMEGHYAP